MTHVVGTPPNRGGGGSTWVGLRPVSQGELTGGVPGRKEVYLKEVVHAVTVFRFSTHCRVCVSDEGCRESRKQGLEGQSRSLGTLCRGPCHRSRRGSGGLRVFPKILDNSQSLLSRKCALSSLLSPEDTT